jgi:hypothetical protein
MRIKSKNTGQGAKVGDYDTINHIEVKPDKLKNLSFIDAFKKDISEKHLVSIIELCKKYPNDMELGNKIRSYRDQMFF